MNVQGWGAGCTGTAAAHSLGFRKVNYNKGGTLGHLATWMCRTEAEHSVKGPDETNGHRVSCHPSPKPVQVL